VGDAFVQGLRDRTGRDIAASAVNYPAHQDIGPGVNDLNGQLNSIANRCPNTRIIVGGYSLGAGVTNRVLNDPLPAGSRRSHCCGRALRERQPTVGRAAGTWSRFRWEVH
jgi:hypothetical protein